MRTFRAPWASAWKKVKIGVFTLAGFLFGVAGVIGAIRLGQGQIAIGDDKMFPAQAAVVVGGTSLAGGKGSELGTILGVFTVAIIENGMNFIGVNAYYQNIVFGIFVLAAIALTVDRSIRGQIVK